MPHRYPKITDDWVELGRAWEVFADIHSENSRYRDRLRELRIAGHPETVSQSEERQKNLEVFTRKLQRLLLEALHAGEFVAKGRDITLDIASPEQMLPSDLFHPYAEGLEIDWDTNRMWVLGKIVIGVEVKRVIEALISNGDIEKTVALSPVSIEDFPSSPGAPSFEPIREEAILYCYRVLKGFDVFVIDKKIERIKDYVVANYDREVLRRGFGRTAIYETIKALKMSGRISSDNGRK